MNLSMMRIQDPRKILSKLDKDLFYLSSSFTNDIFIELPYDQQNTIDNFVLNISSNSNVEINKEVEVFYKTPEASFNSIKNKFSIESSLPNRSYLPVNSGLLEISYLTNDIDKGIEILNMLILISFQKLLSSRNKQDKLLILLIKGLKMLLLNYKGIKINLKILGKQ